MRVLPRLRRTRALVLVATALVLGAGCQVRTDVTLTVDRDGSGQVAATVALDRQAAARIPNLAAQLRVTDLRRAGWRVTTTTRRSDGAMRITAVKPFGQPAQAGAVLEELAGRGGPFDGFAVSRSHSFARTSLAVRGSVDLHRGLRAFSDARVAALLGGKPFGRTEAELRVLTRGSVADAASFRVRVRLPGTAERVYDLRLGDRPLPIDVRATDTDTKAYLLVAAAILAVGVALVFTVLGVRNRRRPPRAQRGMGAYDRRRYEAISEVEDGPPPGTGGTPELIRVRRPRDAPDQPGSGRQNPVSRPRRPRPPPDR